MVKLNQLTTAEAMSHPDVAATVNALGKMCDELRTQNQALLKEMRYIAGVSNGQVKRVAEQALEAVKQAQPEPALVLWRTE